MVASLPIACVVAARPNFMKIGPVVLELRRRKLPYRFVHTGQHYDDRMSTVFFDDLGLPRPDVNLAVGSGSHAEQTAQVMTAFEVWLQQNPVCAVLVGGDVNSTMACALAAVKLHIPVVHLEAGLRSGDRRMPEEINRVVTDVIADLLLTPSPDGDLNLRAEGIPAERIVRVGNAMIDSLLANRGKARDRAEDLLQRLGVSPREYALVTLHRPSNVDRKASLQPIMAVFAELAEQIPVLFPAHPRTRAQLGDVGQVRLLEPVGYLDFIALEELARMVITDSGGIQEETTVFGVPCLTVRDNTERPITCAIGSNTLVGTAPQKLRSILTQVLAGHYKQGQIPELWDGQTASRVVDTLVGRYHLSD